MKKSARETAMNQEKIQIERMSCQHCVMRIKRALDGTAGIISSEVSVGEASVSFDETKLSRKDIENVIVKAGYKIRG